MKTRTAVLLSLSVTVALLSSGCVFAIGCPGKGNEPCKTTQPTRGAELMDLKKAHEEGAMTQEEYDQARQRILEK
jgi:hypothetical protein